MEVEDGQLIVGRLCSECGAHVVHAIPVQVDDFRLSRVIMCEACRHVYGETSMTTVSKARKAQHINGGVCDPYNAIDAEHIIGASLEARKNRREKRERRRNAREQWGVN